MNLQQKIISIRVNLSQIRIWNKLGQIFSKHLSEGENKNKFLSSRGLYWVEIYPSDGDLGETFNI